MASFSRFRLQRAVHALRQGELLAYPTEGVWGLGCDPLNETAVLSLLQLKQRPLAKGLILVAATMDQLAPYLEGLTVPQAKALEASWPGPHTWLVPANAQVPFWISGGQPTVALRVSAHPLVQALCNTFGGAIVSTSANRSGKAAARSLLDVQLQFSSPHRNGQPRVILVPGSLGKEGKPSTIRDLQTGKIIRN
jgi:L-threonylcarbamoyladenylate synthase